MSFLIELKVPDIGNVSDVEVAEVLIQPGDVIELDQTIVIMESDKATMDLPASAAGTVEEVKVKVGDTVSEGSLIATVRASTDEVARPAKETPESSEEKSEPAEVAVQPAEQQAAAKPEQKPQPAATQAPPAAGRVSSKAHASPAVRRFARELGVDIGKIEQGSGNKGRILKEDVKKFITQVMSSGGVSGGGIPAIPAVDFSRFGDIEEKPLSKIKRLTGQGMSRVWLNLPMVTQHGEADITEMEAFRKSLNQQQATDGRKITPLAFIIKALLAAMRQYPQFNASLSADGDKLILKKYYNIGIAVDTANGLVVPVIRDADQKSIIELVDEMTGLSDKARQGKLLPADMQGGCMTISSLGGIGGTAFTPIVNAPEVAILGVSRATMKPFWNGQEFVPRLMLPLDLTYDHRVIDGADGARFVVAIAEYLDDIRRLLL